MRRTASVAIGGALGLLVLAAPARTQQAVPGVRAELVQLDVVVTDAKGALVRDLTRDEFEVLEDGKPQPVAQFFAVGRAAAPSSTRAESSTRADSAVTVTAPAPAPPPLPGPEAARSSATGRQVVIVVDDLHIGVRGLVEAKRVLRQFVEQLAAPDDNIALVTTRAATLVQPFTRDHSALAQAIEGLTVQETSVGPARNSRMTPEQAALVLRGDRAALQLASETIISEPGSLFSENSLRAAMEAAPGEVASGRDAIEKAAQKEAERQAAGILGEALRFSLASMNTIEDVVRSLGRLPGRKLCLVVSDGFLDGSGSRESRSLDLRRIVDAATRSGTVVYTLDSRGLINSTDAGASGVAVSAGLQQRVERLQAEILRETLTTIANTTGGFFVRGTNDLAGGLRRMLADNDAYYLMAYEPLNTRRDGRFRKIEVRLPRRPELSVRTRTGYYAPDEKKEAAATRAAGATPAPAIAAGRAAAGAAGAAGPAEVAQARAVLSAPIDKAGIPIALSAEYLHLPPAGSQVLVHARVDLAGLRWQEAEGRRRADLELVGGVFDAAGQPVGAPFGRRAELDLAPADFERARTAGLDYQQMLALPPGRYEVRVVAREHGLAQQGGTSQSVEVPDLAEKKLTMSGVFLSTAAAGAAAAAADVRHRFKRGDNVSFQFYVYNPMLDASGAADVVLQAQVWSGGKVVAASRPQPARLQQKDGAPVPETNALGLEGLPPGAYELRVVVQDRKAGATTLRRVAFTID